MPTSKTQKSKSRKLTKKAIREIKARAKELKAIDQKIADMDQNEVNEIREFFDYECSLDYVGESNYEYVGAIHETIDKLPITKERKEELYRMAKRIVEIRYSELERLQKSVEEILVEIESKIEKREEDESPWTPDDDIVPEKPPEQPPKKPSLWSRIKKSLSKAVE